MISHSFRVRTAIALSASGLLLAPAAISFAAPPVSAPAVTGNVLKGPWSDSTLSPDARADAALAVMTQKEKIALLRTPSSYEVPGVTQPRLLLSAGRLSGVPRLGIAPVGETDASLGVSNVGGTRKGDVATALPSSLALGASWNPELAFRGGAMIGSEARAKGFGVMLAGGVNLLRDPRAGRNFEYISEDPLLTGILGGRAIAGVQSNHIVSTIKHYALNNQETGRNIYSIDIAEAPARESDLLAFQIATEIGEPGSVMCGYNRINGIYACENRFLLIDVLRRDWGFKGWVMSDWGATHSVGAIQAGLDQQSGYMNDPKPFFGAELEKALAAGEVPQSAVDTAVRRILRSLFAHGIVDAPPVPGVTIDYDTNAKVAQQQAEEGIVLLRNEGAILPLAATAKRIAVIGRHADRGTLSGGGSSQVVPVGGLAVELRELGKNPIRRSYGGTAPLAAIRAAFPGAQVDFADGQDRNAAARIAANADVTVVFAEKWFYEGADAPDLSLGEGQDALIDAVARANPKTVVVLQTGNPVAMPWREQVPAILVAWYPGQRGGDAIARILSGAVNPSGHLPMTWPAAIDQLPLTVIPGTEAQPGPDGQTGKRAPFAFSYPEGSDAGYRWFDKKRLKPLYPFGHGLSYSQFRYSNLSVSGGKQLKASFTVTNDGKRTGADVAQVYVVRAGRAKRLIGWGKPVLAPGASGQVEVTADPRILADFDPKQRRWVVPAGPYRVEVGMSAAEPMLTGTARVDRRLIKP